MINVFFLSLSRSRSTKYLMFHLVQFVRLSSVVKFPLFMPQTPDPESRNETINYHGCKGPLPLIPGLPEDAVRVLAINSDPIYSGQQAERPPRWRDYGVPTLAICVPRKRRRARFPGFNPDFFEWRKLPPHFFSSAKCDVIASAVKETERNKKAEDAVVTFRIFFT